MESVIMEHKDIPASRIAVTNRSTLGKHQAMISAREQRHGKDRLEARVQFNTLIRCLTLDGILHLGPFL